MLEGGTERDREEGSGGDGWDGGGITRATGGSTWHLGLEGGTEGDREEGSGGDGQG